MSQEDDPDDGSGAKRFECYWIPLTQGHTLSAGQVALLGRLPYSVDTPPCPVRGDARPCRRQAAIESAAMRAYAAADHPVYYPAVHPGL
ncbi:MAG: hypothetical protein WKF82_10490 [Nocardioidaceae bacterium]